MGDIEKGLIDRLGDPSYGNTWEREVRHGFIRKVFGILSVQLLITTIVGAVFVLVEPVKDYVSVNMWPMYLALGITIVLVIVMVCVESARRTHPTNLILLFAFTLAESYLVGAISASVQAEYVLCAFGITAVIVVSLTIYASQTKYDFTTCGGLLMGLFLALMLASILGIFFFQNRIYYAVISGVGAFLFSMYLIYDVQLIMGGRQYEIGPDEYVFGALTLYLDIINIFLYILSFFSR
eukprot:TRINITY_DN12765_c0_g1_i5.p2 TRINITY_DN12765_c0_g1~~TRINITY_DN12765_c0_g1_i5.p2  ORF type:complete len:238 (+),score=14.19 TRINITY_DN12765_c0_g1_i5:155-868(+)